MVDQGTDPMAATAAETEPGSAATIDSQEAARSAVATPIALGVVERALYTDRQPLAEGGMGKVVIARDARLGRKVAIKELRIDHPAARARFEREAALTARLEHPGIVGIHEAGKWPSGEPFFAMRVIAGRSLDKLFAERKDRNARLALVPNVLAVADAVAYAHEQRIIHRDLKPQNVMVGEFGETVVIDWGLAKELGSDELASLEGTAASGDLTTAGSVIGTPMYLPPEQARGEEVDRTADVYAIGAILYELCAGGPPYTARSVDELLAKVVDGPPDPLPADIAPELVAITARAMARDREERYPSARELAEDLRRFQTGQLVGAHRYTTGQLLRRWIRKHRAILITATIALVALVGLGVYSVHNIMVERREAKAQRALAVEARSRAEALVDFMQQDLRKQLEAANKLELLEPAARKVIEYRERALDETDRTLIALANSYKQLGDSQLSRGDFAAVKVSVDAALAAYRKIPSPTATIRRDISVLTNTLGDIQMQQGDSKGALTKYREALAIVDEVRVANPTVMQYALDVDFTQGKITDALMLAGDTKGALAAARAGSQLLDGLAPPAEEAKARQLVAARAKGTMRAGEILHRIGDSKAALVQLLKAKELTDQVAAVDKSWRAQRDVGVALDRIARIRIATGDTTGARADLEQSLAISSRLAAIDTTNAVLERDLIVTNNQISDLLSKAKDPAGAAKFAQQALDVAERMSARVPTNARATADVASSYERLSGIEAQLAKPDRAVELAERARALRTKLVEQDPKNTQWRTGLMTNYYRTTKVLLLAKRYQQAKPDAEKALEMAKQLAAGDPSDLTAKRDVSLMETTLADVLDKLGDKAGALLHYEADLAIAESLAATDPKNRRWQIDLAGSHSTVGEQLVVIGDKARAKTAFDTALAILDRLGPDGDADLAKAITAARDKCCR